MSNERPWVRGELTWIQSGPLYRVHTDALTELSRFLDRWSYRRIELEGTLMTSRREAHNVLKAAFEFPDYYGRNWDAFNDCFGDFVAENDGALIAVVWRDIETAARTAPATVAEVCWGLLSHAHEYGPRLEPSAGASVWMDVFAVGIGEDFDRPHAA
jgi:RNAse (barnase) inhibitor barstar